MGNHLIGYLICAGIVLFGLLHHLVDWSRPPADDAPAPAVHGTQEQQRWQADARRPTSR